MGPFITTWIISCNLSASEHVLLCPEHTGKLPDKEGTVIMSDCTHLHETIIKDVLDIWDDIKSMDFENLPKQKERGSFSSIAKGTQNLVLTFPVACSTNMSIQSAAMVSKAIERKCVTMVQMLLASFQVTDTDNIQDFLAQFHTNLTTRDFSIDDIVEAANMFAELPGVEVNREQFNAVMADMKNLDYLVKGPIQARPLSEYSIMEYGREMMVMKEDKKVTMSADDYMELKKKADAFDGSAGAIAGLNQQIADMKSGMLAAQLHSASDRTERDNALKDLNDLQAQFADFNNMNKADQEKLKANYNAKVADIKAKYGGMGDPHQVSAYMKNSADYFNKMVIGNELKKANELAPSLLAVNFVYKNSNGDPVVIKDVIIGVKTKLTIIDSYDMMDHLASKTQDANWVTQLLRSTTREISFIKDFLLMLDRAKIDALSYSRRGSANKMWKVLERRALKSRMKRAFGRNNNAAAITTMVLSQEEVDFMKKNFHVDLANPSQANKILDGYNLMGFVIVDETMETAKFLFDTGDDIWETLSFGSLEREAGDNTYKKVINMMTKVVR